MNRFAVKATGLPVLEPGIEEIGRLFGPLEVQELTAD